MADLDVDLAELLLAALNGAGGHRPGARSFNTFLLQQLRGGMTHLQSKTVALSPPPDTGPPATRRFLLLGMWNNDLD